MPSTPGYQPSTTLNSYEYPQQNQSNAYPYISNDGFQNQPPPPGSISPGQPYNHSPYPPPASYPQGTQPGFPQYSPAQYGESRLAPGPSYSYNQPQEYYSPQAGFHSLPQQPFYSQPGGQANQIHPQPSYPYPANSPQLDYTTGPQWAPPSQDVPHSAPSYPTNLHQPPDLSPPTAARTTPIKIKLHVKSNPTNSTTIDPSVMAGRNSRTSNGSHSTTTESANRPVRGSRGVAKPKYNYDDLDEDFEGVDKGEPDAPDADDDEYGNGDSHPVRQAGRKSGGRSSTGSTRIKVANDFEDTMMPDTSPPQPVVKKRKRVIDPDDSEDEEEDGAEAGGDDGGVGGGRGVNLRSRQSVSGTSGPSYGNGNGNGNTRHSAQRVTSNTVLIEPPRQTRGSTKSQPKSRHSSADEDDFEPSGDEGSASEESPDPIEEDFNEDDLEDDLESYDEGRRSTRQRQAQRRKPSRSTRSTRRSARVAAKPALDSDDGWGESSNRNNRRRSGAFEPITKRLRERASKIDYTLPGQLDEAELRASAIAAVSRPRGGMGMGMGARGIGMAGGVKSLPWSAKGRDLAKAMGDSDSDSDDFASPMKNASAGPSGGAAAIGGARPGNPTDVQNYGRINPKSSMADADPLGVDMNVTFDNVGGLDGHINQLKEMVALPLLYPELFQQFGVTPPRGVLFHGPPGTGKTLLARALAASCSTGNTKIAFFMRKGADVLSKWVGEAERQLRMLFEEARASQPSIIFFDEIDGLAPVRSSKQDQIHASLVSTLLALMDGMDGRGQVIVIGATNRPDAVDPALRRPGRFDREFYFPLPNRDARKKIISINTRKWDPALEEPVLDRLAGLTKGYGGADLRALCTEAALNAIQRRYPQIYRSADRLLLDTKSIHVLPKDFMISIKKVVPSSARSAASAAIPLPPQLLPLLTSPLEKLKKAVDHVLPPSKARTALEEAEFEDEDGDSFEKEMMLQSLDKLRTYRPRILVYGDPGMGQSYIGPAILHHLEGFHVQNFDLATLMSDSTRTPEATIVQLFVEAKRHQPSIIFIPSLSQWAANLSDTARATVRALLDGIPPSDPILMLAIVDGPLDVLPYDVKSWFGFGQENRIDLDSPSADARADFFAELIKTIQRPPTEFPDGVPRKKRVLEILPPAPPLPPRQPTEAELARETEKDAQARDMLVISFISLVQEFMKKYRRVVANVKADAMEMTRVYNESVAVAAAVPEVTPHTPPADGQLIINGHSASEVPADVVTDVAKVGAIEGGVSQPVDTTTPPKVWQAHDVDIDIIHRRLTRHKYFTPADFMADIAKIEENAERVGDPERQVKITEMAYNARIHVMGFDPKWTPEFERYSQRMKARKAERAARKELEKGKEKEGTPTAVSGLKRIREDDEVDEERSDKRSKGDGEDDITMTELPHSHLHNRTGDGSLAMAIPSPEDTSAIRQPHPDFVATTPPTPISHLPPSLALRPIEVNPVPSVPSPRPVIHPPFIVPQGDIQSLAAVLKHQTGSLNVDQLEQLRAMLLDKVWRGRTEWDRTKVIGELAGVLKRFVDEVEGGLGDA